MRAVTEEVKYLLDKVEELEERLSKAEARLGQRQVKPPLLEVARLVQPDGEMRHLSFRMPEEMSARIDETEKVLGDLPDLSSLYGVVDRATAIRHILACHLLRETPLYVRPLSRGVPVTLNLSQALYEKLEAKIPVLLGEGARSNAGVGTVVRYILAAALALGEIGDGEAGDAL
jgi:hypothetical protein